MTAIPDDRRLDRSVLEEERDFFVRSLRDLEAERAAGDIDDVDYQSLRDDYTVRAAEVLRQLAAVDGPGSGGVAAGAAGGVVAGAAGGVAAGAAGGVVAGGGGAATADRPSPDTAAAVADPDLAADGTNPEPGPVEMVAAPSSEVDGILPGTAEPGDGRRRRRRSFIAAAALIVIGGVTFAVVGLLSQPAESVATRVQTLDLAAEAAPSNGQYTKAIQDYEAALRLEPTNVLTLTGEGELLVELGGAGHNPAALALGLTRLQSAEIADPAYGPAYGARGIGYYDEGDYAAAVPQFETYLADTPKASWSTAIESELAAAKKHLAAKG